ncbi:MAG: hypothetical protein AAF561_05520 [Planctomycetota bacterium]
MRLICLGILFVVGCQDPATPPEPSTQQSETASVDPVVTPEGRRLLRIHRLPVALDGGEAAMGYVDDSAIGGELRDRLFANGLRVGLGRVSDLPAVIELAGAEMMTTRAVVAAGPGPQAFTLNVPDDIARPRESLTLFWHNGQGLSGRTFGPSLPTLGVTYSTAPTANADATRMTFVPRVETRVGRTTFLPTGLDRTMTQVVDESLAGAGFTVDVPDRRFVLIAASPEASLPTSLGHQLLRLPDRDGEMMLVIVPGRVALMPTAGR